MERRKKRKLKIVVFKNVMERGNRKILSVIRQLASKIFGKIILKPW